MKTTVQLKQHYLGGTFPGQELVEIQIEISEYMVIMRRRVGGVVVREICISDVSGVFCIKRKLRASWGRIRASGRWSVETYKGVTRMTCFTPSRRWASGRLQVRWLGIGAV